MHQGEHLGWLIIAWDFRSCQEVCFRRGRCAEIWPAQCRCGLASASTPSLHTHTPRSFNPRCFFGLGQTNFLKTDLIQVGKINILGNWFLPVPNHTDARTAFITRTTLIHWSINYFDSWGLLFSIREGQTNNRQLSFCIGSNECHVQSLRKFVQNTQF